MECALRLCAFGTFVRCFCSCSLFWHCSVAGNKSSRSFGSTAVYLIYAETVAPVTQGVTFLRTQCSYTYSLKATPHSKLVLGFFSRPKSRYFCDLSLTSCTFVKLQFREQGTNLYGDTGELAGHCNINLEIRNQWLYHGTDERRHSVVL